EQFKDTFTNTLEDINVDDGLKEGTDMRPWAHERRLTSMQQVVDDGTQKGAKVLLGGENTSEPKRYFYMPTVLIDVPKEARVMTEEPFGPIAPLVPFTDHEAVIEEPNSRTQE